MNRRDFIVAAALAAVAPLPVIARPQYAPGLQLRRVNIVRATETELLRDRPFSEIWQGDAIQIIGTAEDPDTEKWFYVHDRPGVAPEPYYQGRVILSVTPLHAPTYSPCRWDTEKQDWV